MLSGSWIGSSKITSTTTRSANLPTISKLRDLRIYFLCAIGSGEIVRWFVVVDTEETAGFTETPARNVHCAHVTQEITIDTVTIIVGDDYSLTISNDTCLLINEGHFYLLAIECDAEVSIDLNLAAITQNSQRFANDFAVISFVVSHYAETVMEKVTN